MKNAAGKHLVSWWDKTKKRMSKEKEAPEQEATAATAETTANNDNLAEATQTAENDANETQKLQAEIEELNKKYLYLMSEFENYKRRTSKERLELFKTASKDLIVELLPVLDDFERGLEVMEKAQDVAAVKQGVDLVYHKFKGVLTAKGLTPIVAQDQAFDPDLHEAISQAPAGEEAVNKVVQEVEKGYKLHDSVLRYAKVIVGA
jgi:molecular chaperone GrpE